MDRSSLAELNLGQSLDDLANLDGRGYGVSRILYRAARHRSGGPLSMGAAKVLSGAVKPGGLVHVLTGFVLLPHKKAEMDGIVGSLCLARALAAAFGAKPVIVCPADCVSSIRTLAPIVGLHCYQSIEDLRKFPLSMAVLPFTKDRAEASVQAEDLMARGLPDAVISVEAPGANAAGVYHNAAGADVSDLEAKSDALFEALASRGVATLSVGDLGNEIGMGAIGDHILRFVPRAASCAASRACPCGAGLLAATSADCLVTATVSDWGCYAVIAALAYLLENPELMPTGELVGELIAAASRSGLVDMGGALVPAVDGFDRGMNESVASLMRDCVSSALRLRTSTARWFDEVLELGFFEEGLHG